MSGNWGIKADDGYVNFIHGTIDKVCDFETSSSIDDVCIFSEMVAKGYAKAIKANAIQISISEQPQLTIPKSIAEMLDEELNPLERESMLETFVLGINYLVLSDELMKFVLTGNNYHVISAYLAGKALGVELVKVVEGLNEK